MSKPVDSAQRAHTTPDRTAVLLTNLGTPQAPTASALRPYLRQFLSDPRVIEVPRLIWQLILNGVILLIRPRRSARAYREIWTEQGSPLAVDTEALAHAVDQRLPQVKVEWAMRYGQPSIDRALRSLLESGYRRVFVLPLYPQYSATTTASTFDAVADCLKGTRWIPDLRFNTAYHDQPEYIHAIADSIESYWAEHGQPDKLLFSFHGIPQSYFDKGDPYFCQCQRTVREVVERLALGHSRYAIAFQSRVGKQVWLRPYTEDILERWGKEGVENVHVVCPGFSVDCLETLEEIAIRGREDFLEAGGKALSLIPCLNASDRHADAIAAIVQRQIAGWPTEQNEDDLTARIKRAEALQESLD